MLEVLRADEEAEVAMMTVDPRDAIETALMRLGAEMAISIEEAAVLALALEAQIGTIVHVETVATAMMQTEGSQERTAATEMRHVEQVEVQRESQPLH